jgi:hypothetical protein
VTVYAITLLVAGFVAGALLGKKKKTGSHRSATEQNADGRLEPT